MTATATPSDEANDARLTPEPLDDTDWRDDIADAVAALGRLLVAEETVETTLHRVVDLAKRTIPGCDAAGVTLLGGSTYATVAFTDGRTLAVDEDQYRRDHGPCLHALKTQTIVRTSGAETQRAWPDFAIAAAIDGIRSFLAIPLSLQGKGIGALNLYSKSEQGFDVLDDGLALIYAAQATVALANARVYDDAVSLSQQLETAITSRAVIEQAKGVLMARHHIDAEAAFRLLRQHSQHGNVKLRAIALDVVASTADAALTPTAAMPATAAIPATMLPRPGPPRQR